MDRMMVCPGDMFDLAAGRSMKELMLLGAALQPMADIW